MEGKQIGAVINFFEKPMVVAVQLTEPLKLGSTIRIIGGDKDFTEVVDAMQIEGKFVDSAKAGDGVGIKISEKVGKGYKVFLVK